MFQNDWIMRQIEMAVQFIVRMLFGRELLDDGLIEEIRAGESGPLLRKLEQMIKKSKINEAENLLFDAMSPGDVETLRVALVFYETLNAMDDRALDDAGFGREEIRDGLSDITRQYGINIMDLFELE